MHTSTKSSILPTPSIRLHHAALAVLLALAPGLACDDSAAEVPADELPSDEAPADEGSAADLIADGGDRLVGAPPIKVEGDAAKNGEIQVNGTTLADLELPRGPRLVFIDVAGADEAPAVGVYEYVPEGHVGTSAFTDLADASPLALFLAATAEGVEIPARLLAHGDAASDRIGGASPRPRGWLIDAAASALVPRGYCTNSEFQDAVNSYGYSDLGTPTFRLNQQPSSSGHFITNIYTFYPEMASRTAYLYWVGAAAGSRWSNIDAYYTRVAVCALGSHPDACGSGGCVDHPGPTINIAYRDSNDNPYGYATVVNHDYDGLGVSAWHWQSGSNWDWRTRIDLAASTDSFDIGHAVEVD